MYQVSASPLYLYQQAYKKNKETSLNLVSPNNSLLLLLSLDCRHLHFDDSSSSSSIKESGPIVAYLTLL